jgi:hypothetical protein
MEYGFGKGIVMATSQLYNIEVLVNFYACIGAWRYLSQCTNRISVVFPPIGTALFYCWMSFGSRWNHSLSIFSIFVIAFIADGFFLSFRYALNRFLKGTWRSETIFTNRSVSVCFLFWILVWAATYVWLEAESLFWPQFVVGVTSIATVLIFALVLVAKLPEEAPSQYTEWIDRQTNFVVWLILLLPFITVGDLYVVLKGLSSWVACKISVPIAFRLALAIHVQSRTRFPVSSLHPEKKLFIIRLLRVVAVGISSWRLFVVNINDEVVLHAVPTLLLVATVCDTVELLCLI